MSCANCAHMSGGCDECIANESPWKSSAPNMLSISTLEFLCRICGKTVTCGPTQEDIERIVTKVCGTCEQAFVKRRDAVLLLQAPVIVPTTEHTSGCACSECDGSEPVESVESSLRHGVPTLRETLGPIVDYDANPNRDRREYNSVCMKRIGHASWCERPDGHAGDCQGPPPQYEVRRDVDKKFLPDTPRFGISFNRGGWIEVREPKPKDEG